MTNKLNNNLKSKIKGLAYYQIGGGVLGFLLTFWAIFNTLGINSSSAFLFLFVTCFCAFTIFCGVLLIKGATKTGLKYSMINQILQCFNIALPVFSFRYVAGLSLNVGIDYTNDLNPFFNLYFGEFQLHFSGSGEQIIVGINLIAIYLIYLIGKIQHEIELKEMLSGTSNFIK